MKLEVAGDVVILQSTLIREVHQTCHPNWHEPPIPWHIDPVIAFRTAPLSWSWGFKCNLLKVKPFNKGPRFCQAYLDGFYQHLILFFEIFEALAPPWPFVAKLAPENQFSVGLQLHLRGVKETPQLPMYFRPFPRSPRFITIGSGPNFHARHMSKAKSTASSKTSSRLVRNQTVELVSRTVGPRFLGRNGRSEGTGTVFFLKQTSKGHVLWWWDGKN